MTCTHLIDPMSAFCRCALDPERDHCGVYSELCHGNNWPCYADLGPWGAWRAVIAHVAHNAGVIAGLMRVVDADRCNVLAMLGLAGIQIETMYILDAAGWSPSERQAENVAAGRLKRGVA